MAHHRSGFADLNCVLDRPNLKTFSGVKPVLASTCVPEIRGLGMSSQFQTFQSMPELFWDHLSSTARLTHSFPMHPISTYWKHQKTLCIGNEWVN